MMCEPPDPLAEYGLGRDLFDCPECENTGRLIRQDADGCLFGRECSCMVRRYSLRRIKRSGLEDAIKRYTFDNYQTPDEKRTAIKDAAVRFCADNSGWFFIAGQSGSGKSHVCTAIFGALVDRGHNVRYMRWRDESTKLKAAVNDAEDYDQQIKPLTNVPVLYIDDFLKGDVTAADLKLAFTILDARYSDARLRTIISTERSLQEIMELDEAIGGRIVERSRGYIVQAPGENWRTRKA